MNPADTWAVPLTLRPGQPVPAVAAQHHSYAWLSIPGRGVGRKDGAHGDTRDEWQETLNTSAVVLGDRAIGAGPHNISSLWTESDSGDWRGAAVRNDNSTAFETVHAFDQTQYGRHPANRIDDLFDDDPAVIDAYLVHDDATTAYSAR